MEKSQWQTRPTGEGVMINGVFAFAIIPQGIKSAAVVKDKKLVAIAGNTSSLCYQTNSDSFVRIDAYVIEAADVEEIRREMIEKINRLVDAAKDVMEQRQQANKRCEGILREGLWKKTKRLLRLKK